MKHLLIIIVVILSCAVAQGQTLKPVQDTLLPVKDSVMTEDPDSDTEPEAKTDSSGGAAISYEINAPSSRSQFSILDSISYQKYLKGNWKEVIDYNRMVIDSGYDYYYLRMRTAIAYFELQQFRKAIPEFLKAVDFNKTDPVAARYLLNSYLYLDRLEEANWAGRGLGAYRDESGKIGKSPVQMLQLENGFKKSDSVRYFKSPLFAQFSLQHELGSRLTLLHSFNYFTQREARFEVSQYQYYLRATTTLPHSWLVCGSFHTIHDRVTVMQNAIVTETLRVTSGPPPPPGAPPNYITVQVPVMIPRTTQTSAGVGSLEFVKQLPVLNFSLGATAASLDTTSQFQINGGLAFFPLYNSKFVLGSNIYYHTEEQSSGMAVTPFITGYVSNHLHLSASGYFNSGNNISEHTGLLVTNSPDYTLNRILLTASLKVFKHAWLYVSAGHETKKHLTAHYLYHYTTYLAGIRIFPSNL